MSTHSLRVQREQLVTLPRVDFTYLAQVHHKETAHPISSSPGYRLGKNTNPNSQTAKWPFSERLIQITEERW